MTSPFKKSIQYDRETRDYRATLDGQLIGWFRSHHEAEVELDRVAFDWLTHGYDALACSQSERPAAEMDTPVEANPITTPSETFTFTRQQLNALLFATIDMYLEFRDMHEHDADGSRFEAVDEMFQGLDADRELARSDPTERLRLQLA